MITFKLFQNKKGLAADLMDYMVLTIASFFCLLVIWGALKMGVAQADEKSIENIQEVAEMGDQISASRAKFASGEVITLAEIEQLGEEGVADG